MSDRQQTSDDWEWTKQNLREAKLTNAEEMIGQEREVKSQPTPTPLTREPRRYHHPRCSWNATNGPDGDFCNCKMVVDYPEYAALRQVIAQQAQELKEEREISEWYGTLVTRANIGTKETPSLRAYIEQTEAQLATTTQELETAHEINRIAALALVEREQEVEKERALRKENGELIGNMQQALNQQAQEVERLTDRNRNLMDVLRAIASMSPNEADRMQQWAKDGLSGFTEPIESTVLKLTDQLAAMTKERDEAVRKHDELAAIIIANKIQVQTVQRNRDLQAQLAASQARVKELEKQRDELNKLSTYHEKLEDDMLEKYTQLQATLAAREVRIKELEEWQEAVIGSGTDQEMVIMMAADKYTKSVAQEWKEHTKYLEAKLNIARQEAARLRNALKALWRLTENQKIQDLDAHAIIKAALKGA